MVDIRVGPGRTGVGVKRVDCQVSDDILVNLLLQVDSHRAIRTDHYVCAYPGVCRYVAARVRDSDVRGVITHVMMGSFDCVFGQVLQESTLGCACCGRSLRSRGY